MAAGCRSACRPAARRLAQYTSSRNAGASLRRAAQLLNRWATFGTLAGEANQTPSVVPVRGFEPRSRG